MRLPDLVALVLSVVSPLVIVVGFVVASARGSKRGDFRKPAESFGLRVRIGGMSSGFLFASATVARQQSTLPKDEYMAG